MRDPRAVKNALTQHQIELPSWAFGNSGTRFKVFGQPGVPRTPYKLGSVCNPDPRVRRKALDHLLECVDIMHEVVTADALAKALLVDVDALNAAQLAGDVLAANAALMDAYNTDVRPLLAELRAEMGAGSRSRRRLSCLGLWRRDFLRTEGGVPRGLGSLIPANGLRQGANGDRPSRGTF